jgi:hypothetical protein
MAIANEALKTIEQREKKMLGNTEIDSDLKYQIIKMDDFKKYSLTINIFGRFVYDGCQFQITNRNPEYVELENHGVLDSEFDGILG